MSGVTDDSSIISVTMSKNAAERFLKALSYGEALVHNQAEANQAPTTKRQIEEHGEWLRWGYSRVHGAKEGLI